MSTPSSVCVSLDYLYFSAPDTDEAVRFYTQGLGGTLVWGIRDDGTSVAAVRLTAADPLILLADPLATESGWDR